MTLQPQILTSSGQSRYAVRGVVGRRLHAPLNCNAIGAPSKPVSSPARQHTPTSRLFATVTAKARPGISPCFNFGTMHCGMPAVLYHTGLSRGTRHSHPECQLVGCRAGSRAASCSIYSCTCWMPCRPVPAYNAHADGALPACLYVHGCAWDCISCREMQHFDLYSLPCMAVLQALLTEPGFAGEASMLASFHPHCALAQWCLLAPAHPWPSTSVANSRQVCKCLADPQNA